MYANIQWKILEIHGPPKKHVSKFTAKEPWIQTALFLGII